MHFILIGHISTGSQFTGQGPPLASRQVWEVAEGPSSLQGPQLSFGHAGLMGPGWQAALGGPFGNKGSETSIHPIPTQGCGKPGR